MPQIIVTIKVGPEEEAFQLHKHVFVPLFPYFEKAFNGNFKEAKDGVLTFGDTTVDAFQIVMNWMYTRQLPSFGTDARAKQWTDEKGSENLYDSLMSQAYIFAECYNVRDLRQDVVRQFVQRFGCQRGGLPKYATIIRLFEQVPENSKLCRYFVDLYVQRFKSSTEPEADKKMRDHLPNAFIVQLFLRFADDRNCADPNNKIKSPLCLEDYLEEDANPAEPVRYY